MWQLVKSEFQYYRIAFSAPLFFTILLQIMEFWNLKVMSEISSNVNGAINSDMWGGFYSFVILFSVFSMLQTRFKEKRERFFTILPVSNKQLAISRFWFVIIPLTVLTLYFIAIHIIVSTIWNINLSIPLIQIGIVFIIFAGFVRARDDWFSHWNFGKRTQTAFITVSIIQILVVTIFLNLSDIYKNFTPVFGDMHHQYIKIIFYILGLVIIFTTIFSYQNRKSYLS